MIRKEILLKILCVLFFIVIFKVTGIVALTSIQLVLLVAFFFFDYVIFEYEENAAFISNIIILGIMLVVLLVSSKLPFCRDGYVLDDTPFNNITVCRDGKYKHETIEEYLKTEKKGDENNE